MSVLTPWDPRLETCGFFMQLWALVRRLAEAFMPSMLHGMIAMDMSACLHMRVSRQHMAAAMSGMLRQAGPAHVQNLQMIFSQPASSVPSSELTSEPSPASLHTTRALPELLHVMERLSPS